MLKHRLEPFTDAVLAIVITIMVLDLHTPPASGWAGWKALLPNLAIYVLGLMVVDVTTRPIPGSWNGTRSAAGWRPARFLFSR